MSYKKGRNARGHQKQTQHATAEISNKDRKAIGSLYTDFDNGRYVECLTTCNKLRERLPDNPDVLAMKGAATYYLPVASAASFFSNEEIGDLSIPTFLRAESWRLINESMALVAKDASSHIPMHIASIVKRHEHREAQAISCLQRAIAVAPSNSLFHKELAILYLHTRDYKKCEQSLMAFLGTAPSGKTALTTRAFAVTSYVCSMLQRKFDQAGVAAAEFRTLLQKTASGTVSQGGAAHRDVSLYRSFYFECVQALQLEHRLSVEKILSAEQGDTRLESVRKFHAQLAEFPAQLRKVRTKKRYDRRELLYQSLAAYRDCKSMYLLTLRRLYCSGPFDLHTYERVFELYLRDTDNLNCTITLAEDSLGAPKNTPTDAYKTLYSQFSRFFAGEVECRCTATPLAACFYHVLEPIKSPKRGCAAVSNPFFHATLCMRLAFLAGDHAAFKAEIRKLLGATRVPIGLLDYIAGLVSKLDRETATGIYTEIINDSGECRSSKQVEACFASHLACLDTGEGACNVERCRSILERAITVCTPEEDAALSMTGIKEPLCLLKDYLNDSASEEAIAQSKERHAKEVCAQTETLRFKDAVDVVDDPQSAELCVLYARLLHTVGRPRSAALMSVLVSTLDNSDRSASRLSVEALMRTGAVEEAYAMYGKFIYQADPWLTSQDSQDISALELLYRDYSAPGAVERLVNATFFGEAGTSTATCQKQVRLFITRVKAALAALEFIFDSYYELVDFHHYVVRTGYPDVYQRAMVDYHAKLTGQRSAQTAIVFILELVICIVKLSDEKMQGLREALLAVEKGLAIQYQERIRFYDRLAKAGKDEKGAEEPDALCDRDPYSIRAFTGFVDDLRHGVLEDSMGYTSGLMAFRLFILVDRVLQPSLAGTGCSVYEKRLEVLKNMLGGRVLLALKGLKDAPLDTVVDLAALVHTGLARVPAALLQASHASLTKFVTEAIAATPPEDTEARSTMQRALERADATIRAVQTQ